MKLLKLNSHGVAHHFALALLVVGIVSAATFHAISSHALTDSGSGSVTTKNTSVSAGATVSISNPAGCKTAPKPHVVYGEHSSCVAFLQSKVGANKDGQFGNGTASRVAAIQKAHYLKDTSGHDVGPCTWAAIYQQTVPSSCKASGAPATPSTQAGCAYINAAHKTVTLSGPYTTASCATIKLDKAYAYCKVNINGTVRYLYRTHAQCAASHGVWTNGQTVPQNASSSTSSSTAIYTASNSRVPGSCRFTATVDHTGSLRAPTTAISSNDCAHKSREIDCKYTVATDTDQLGKIVYGWRTPGTGSTDCSGLKAANPLLGSCRYYPFTGKAGYSETAITVTATQKWCDHRDNGPGNKTRSWVALSPTKRAS